VDKCDSSLHWGMTTNFNTWKLISFQSTKNISKMSGSWGNRERKRPRSLCYCHTSVAELNAAEDSTRQLNTALDEHGCHADVFGRTDDRTMAAGASVTWTHCSVLFEVTWGKTRCVHADAPKRPHGHGRPRGRISLPSPLPPSPPLPLLPPSPLLAVRTLGCVRADAKKIN
jgi:hypothetical protein